MAGAIILKISHGYTIEPKGADPLVDLADEALVQFSLAAAPGAWLVDVLPIRRLCTSSLSGLLHPRHPIHGPHVEQDCRGQHKRANGRGRG